MSLFCLTPAYAASFNSYYCSQNFKGVAVGATMDSVRAACGNPSSTITKEVPVVTTTNNVEWIYTLGVMEIKGVLLNVPTLTISFVDHKVTEIKQNNSLIAAASYCASNGTVNIGDQDISVLAACGQPNFISTEQRGHTTQKEVIEWTYNFGPYKPQIIFDFENGLLTQLSSGQLGH